MGNSISQSRGTKCTLGGRIKICFPHQQSDREDSAADLISNLYGSQRQQSSKGGMSDDSWLKVDLVSEASNPVNACEVDDVSAHIKANPSMLSYSVDSEDEQTVASSQVGRSRRAESPISMESLVADDDEDPKHENEVGSGESPRSLDQDEEPERETTPEASKANSDEELDDANFMTPCTSVKQPEETFEPRIATVDKVDNTEPCDPSQSSGLALPSLAKLSLYFGGEDESALRKHQDAEILANVQTPRCWDGIPKLNSAEIVANVDAQLPQVDASEECVLQ